VTYALIMSFGLIWLFSGGEIQINTGLPAVARKREGA